MPPGTLQQPPGTPDLIWSSNSPYIPESDGVSIERVLDGRLDVIRILEQGIEEPPEEERD